MIENGRNLRYSARDGRLKLAREPRLNKLLGFKVNCGCLVKEDFATSGGYSVVIDNLNCPHLRVQFSMSRIKELFISLLKGPNRCQ